MSQRRPPRHPGLTPAERATLYGDETYGQDQYPQHVGAPSGIPAVTNDRTRLIHDLHMLENRELEKLRNTAPSQQGNTQEAQYKMLVQSNALKSAITTLKTQLSDHEAHIIKQNATIAHLHEANDAIRSNMQAHIAAQQNDINILEAAILDLQNEKKGFQARLSAQQTILNNQLHSIAYLQKQRSGLQNDTTTLEETIRGLRAQAFDQQVIINTRDASIASLEKENSVLEEQLSAQQDIINTRENTISNLEATNTELKSALAQHKTSQAEFTEKIKLLEASDTKFTAMNHLLQVKSDVDTGRITDLEETVKALRSMNTNLQETNTRLEQEVIPKLNADLNDSKDRNVYLNNALVLKDTEIRILEDENKSLKARNTTLAEKLGESAKAQGKQKTEIDALRRSSKKKK